MIALAILALVVQAAPPASIAGQWRSPGGNSIIAIAPCGDKLCGTVLWASAKAQQDARKGTDKLIGAQLLTELQAKGSGWQGRIFIPDKNMRATAKLRLISADQLKVSGCALGKSLCKSAMWTRADGPLPAAE